MYSLTLLDILMFFFFFFFFFLVLYSIAITSLGEERASLYAYASRAFVSISCMRFCFVFFSSSRLRIVTVALPGHFSQLFKLN